MPELVIPECMNVAILEGPHTSRFVVHINVECHSLHITSFYRHLGLITFEPEGADAERYSGTGPSLPFLFKLLAQNASCHHNLSACRCCLISSSFSPSLLRSPTSSGELENDAQHGLGVYAAAAAAAAASAFYSDAQI